MTMVHHTIKDTPIASSPGLQSRERHPSGAFIRWNTFIVAMLLSFLGTISNRAYAQDTAITCSPRWGHIGIPGFNAGGPSTYPSLVVNTANEVFVAYRDAGNGGRITVSKFIGTGPTGWTNVGAAGFSDPGGVSYTNLAIDNSDSLWVAYKEMGTGKVAVRKFDGTNWNLIGSTFSVGTSEFVAIDISSDGVPFVAYRDGSNGRLSVKSLSSGSWVDVGPTFVTSSGIHLNARITIDFDGNTPYVAYRETNGRLSVIKYSESSWSSVGGVFTDSTDYTSLAMHGSTPYVTYMDMSASKKATVKKFDGTSWVTVGSAGFSPGVSMWNDIAISPSGQPVVTFRSDTVTAKAQAMVFDGTSWTYVGNSFFSGSGTDFNQIYVDAAGNYWSTYADNLYSARISVLKVTTSVLEPIVGANFVCTGNTTTFLNSTPGGSWSSSNAAIGSIGTTGVLSGINVGVINVSYSMFAGCTRVKTVSVNIMPGTLSGGTAPFCVNTTVTMSAAGGGTWTSSNPEIATVGSSSGVVTGISGGTSTITLTNAGGCTRTRVVTINAAPSISPITGNLTVATSGITSLLSATPTDGTWSSGSIGVATVNSAGVLTGGATAGTAVISYRATASGCTGTVTAVVTNRSAVTGLIFDGTNDFITLPDGFPSATDFTFEAWVRPTSAVNNARLFDFGSSSTSNMYFTTRDGTSTFPKFVINSGGVEQSVSGTAALANSTWAHLAVTLSGGVARMYVNGVLVGTNSSFTFTPATIGATTTNNIGRSFDGLIHLAATVDEIRFWNVARTLEEIQNNKNCDIEATTGLLAAYRFNNGTAGSNNTTNTTAVDYSGFNKCGTLNNFTLTGTASNYVVGALGLCNSVSLPVFSVNPVAAVCAGQNATVTTTGTGGTWSSSNATVGTINSATGVFTGLSAGTALVSYTVTTNCIPTSFSTVVTVNAQPSAFAGSLSACEGSSSSLVSTPTGGSWSSSNVSVATVGTSGIVSALTSGTTIISYTHSITGCPRTAIFTVNAIPAAISGTTSIELSGTTTLSSTTTGGSWTSANSSIASVDASTGLVTGNTSGTTTISYTSAEGCVRTTAITVNLAPISGSSTTCIGVPVTLTHPLSGGTWSSGSPSVATVGSSSGIVTGVSTGTATITYHAIGLSRTFAVTVVGTAPAISGTTTLCALSATTLSATPGSGSWSSSNLSVATVNASTGVVSGLSAGTAVLTYAVGSCFSTTTITVSAPLAAISGNSNVCINGAIALSHSAGSGSWSSSAPAKATVNSSTGLVTAVATGSTIITFATSPTCYVSKEITVDAAPAAITGTAAVCQNSMTTLSHITPSGTWLSSNTGIATVSASGVVSGVAPGTSVISYFTSEGCFATRVVTVIALPTAIGGTASVCEGSTTTLTGAGTGTWMSENTSVATVGFSGIVSGLTAGTANIVFTLTSTGCSTGRIVTVNALPSPISGSLALCAGSNTSLTSTPSGGSWVSSSTGIATIGETSGLLAGVSSGTSTISYISAEGCRRTAVATINALPASITGSASLCVGSTSTLTSSTASQTWSSSNGSIATVATSTLTSGVVTGVATGVVTISYTNANGCSRTMVVTVTSAPAAIGGDDIVCIGGATTLTNASTGGSWSSSNASRATVNASTGLVSGVSAGSVVITYSLGTTCYVTKTMTVNSAPIGITGAGSVCIGNTLTLSHPVSSGTWSSISASVTVGAASGIVTGVSAGTAIVTYSTSSGCYTAAVVTVNSAPSSITGIAVLCQGATTTLVGSGSGTWSSQSGSIATVGLTNGIVTGVAAGNTNVTFTLSSTGCSTTRVVTVNALPASISGASSVCVGSTTVWSSASAGGSWTSGTPSIAAVATDGTISGIVAGTSNITYTLPGGCSTTRVVTINSLPAPITGSFGLCVGSTATFSSATTGQTWSSSASGVATVVPATGIVTAVSVGNATISYTNAFGCSRTAVVTVSNSATPISGDNEVCIGASTVLTNATTGGSWTSGNTARATVNGVTGAVTGITAGTVSITYQVSAGCFVTKVMTVTSSPADAITGPTSVCVASTVTLSHPVSGGTWISSNGTRATVNASSGVVAGSTAGSVTISYFTNAGCYRTYNMTVNARPNAINGTNVVCEGATTTLTSTTPGGTWINDGSFCTVGNTTGIVTGVNAGVGTVSYVVAATGCSITRAVTVNAQPAPISGSTSLCVGTTSALSSTPSGGTWVSSMIGRGTIGMVTGLLGGTSAGTTVISYTLSNGCRTTTIATVIASPAALTGTNSLCIGGTTTLTSTNAGLTWSSSDASVATVATGTSLTGIVTGVGTGTAIISYASATGCAATSIVTVTASGSPISGADVVCVGGTVAMSNVGGTWSSSNVARATITTAGVVTGVSAGTVTITFRTTPTCFVTKTVTVNSSPADAITGPTAVCQAATIALSHPVAGGSWSSSIPTRASVDAVSGVVRGISGGSVLITYATQPGCFRTHVVNVSPFVYPISGTYVVCQGKTTTLTTSLTGGVWTSGTTSVATVNPTSGVVGGVSNGTSAITYTIPTTGCNTVKDVTVNPLPSVIAGPGAICMKETAAFTATPAGGNWTTSAGIIATVNPSTGAVTGVAAGSVFISYTLPTGCVNRTASPIIVNPLPHPIGGNAILAYGATRTYVSLTAGGVWTSDNAAVTITPTGTATAGMADGNATISYTLATGCAVTRVLTVNATGTRFAASADEATIDMKVYPSPTSGILTVESGVHGNLSVYTIDGKLVSEYAVDSDVTTVSLPDSLASGVYMCRFAGEDDSVKIFRIVCSR